MSFRRMPVPSSRVLGDREVRNVSLTDEDDVTPDLANTNPAVPLKGSNSIPA